MIHATAFVRFGSMLLKKSGDASTPANLMLLAESRSENAMTQGSALVPEGPEKADHNGLTDFCNGIGRERSLASGRKPDLRRLAR